MRINGNKIAIPRYSSNEMKLVFKDFEPLIQEKDEVDVFFENKDISFFELLLLLDFFKSYNKPINLTLAYLPYQRMNNNSRSHVKTLSSVANILNNLQLNNLTVMEPHCSLEDFYNANSFSTVEVLFNKLLKQHPSLKQADVVFTDKGGVERYSHLSDNFLYGQKIRNSLTGYIDSYHLVGNTTSNTAIVIDDIISTGDTILSTIKLLEKQGIKQIYLVCGHLEENKFNKRIASHPLVCLLVSTNSLTKKAKNKKVELHNSWEVLNEK